MARTRAAATASASKRARGSLSREEILEAGLLVAKREELTSLTMKKLAEELGVTAMAIYRHFENKAEIIDGVLDLFVRDAAVAEHEVGKDPEAWRRWTIVAFAKMFDALVETPGVMPYLSTASRFGPAAMAALDGVLDVLRRAGMSQEQAADTFAMMCAYTIGAAGIASASSETKDTSDPEEHRRQMRLRIEAAPRTDFPNVVDGAADLARILHRFPLEKGLEVLLRSSLPD